MRHRLINLMRILLFGLLIHFVVVTWLQYRIGIDGPLLVIVSLWKEILVILWAVGLGVVYHRHIMALWKSDVIFRIISLVLFGSFAITMIISAISGFGLIGYIIAAKYNFLGFCVGRLAYITGTIITPGDSKNLNRRYITVMKWMLILSFVRLAIGIVKPGALKYLGYSKYSYEGGVDTQPPAIYYSEMTSGIQRNQFVFERPITFGFWLVAFWPLFFMIVLRRKPFSQTWLWWVVYLGAVIMTFSRAAWIAWIFQLVLLIYLTYQSQFQRYLRKILAPAIAVIIAVGYLGFHEIFGGGRQFSNTGHVNALITGVNAMLARPLFGRGPGSVGPASHQLGHGYNTENQFLQVIVEYGLIGFIGWMILFTSVIAGGVWLRIKPHKPHKKSDYLIAFAVGMLGISVSGLVLHSFVDRMIVWPFMIIVGVGWGSFIAHRNSSNL